MGWNDAIRGSIGRLGILLALTGTAHAASVPRPTVTIPTSKVTVPTVTAPKVTVPTVKVTVPTVKVTVPVTPKPTVVTPAPKPALVPTPAPAKVVTPTPVATPTYTFVTTAYGTVQVSKNGSIIATTTPQLAAQQYGYQASGVSAPPTAPTSLTVTPIISENVATPSGAVVNTTTGQPVSPPLASTTSPVQTSAPVASISTPTPTNAATATPAYTFVPTSSGTVQVFQNGKLISTTTPQLAAQYGYQLSNTSASPVGPLTSSAPKSQNSQSPLKDVPPGTAASTQQATTQPNVSASATNTAPKSNTTSTTSTQFAALHVSSTATAALNMVASNPAISAKNATSDGRYIYPPGTSGSTTSTGPGQQQCAVLVQALRPDVPGSTSSWAPVGATVANLKGQTIQDANLSPGTPIATFTSTGKYPRETQVMDTAPFNPGAPKEPHSGIFVSYLKDADGNIVRDASGKPIGFEMLAQSAGVSATLEKRLFEPVPSSSAYANIQVENYAYSAISTSSSTSTSSH